MKILKKSKERTAEDNRTLRDGVTAIIDDVCQRGDTALHEYNEKFDDCHRQMLRISREEIEEAYEQITEQELSDLRMAKCSGTERNCDRIREFQSTAGDLSGAQNYSRYILLLLCARRWLSSLLHCADVDYPCKSGRREAGCSMFTDSKRYFEDSLQNAGCYGSCRRR